MIHAAPRDFVAQERVSSRAPRAWVGRSFDVPCACRRASLRGESRWQLFCRDAWRADPGLQERRMIWSVSMQSGGGSKDTWVLADPTLSSPEPARYAAQCHCRTEPVSVTRSRGMPSRVADHLFWLGRYTERLEQLLRRCAASWAGFQVKPAQNSRTESWSWLELTANLGSASASPHGPPAASLQRIVTASPATCLPSGPARHRAGTLETRPLHRLHRAGSLFRRHLAHSGPARDGCPLAPRPAPAGQRHCSDSQPRPRSRGLQWHGDGKHDARPRLAVSGLRTASRKRL